MKGDSFIPEFQKSYPDVWRAIPEVIECFAGDPLQGISQRQALISLGLAVHTRDEEEVAVHIKRCLEAGASKREIAGACGIALVMEDCPDRSSAARIFHLLETLGAGDGAV